VRTHQKATVSAIVSGLIAFLSALLTALQGEHSGFGTVTAGQWVTCALAFLFGLGLTGGAAYQVPNRPHNPEPADDDSPTPTRTPAPALSGRRKR
jgi:hypothetical protein